MIAVSSFIAFRVSSTTASKLSIINLDGFQDLRREAQQLIS
jgi:hypothetical protein